MKELLKNLTETPGVSGSERQIREFIKEKAEKHADNIEEDDLGNLYAKKGSGDKTLMIATHMDQIGLAVKRITEEGFIKFSKVGGVTRQSLLNQRITIHTGDGKEVTGVIGMKPPHLMDKEERENLPEIENLFIDIGAEDDEEIEELGINVGDFITFERETKELQNKRITGKALDNRVGAAIGIESLKKFEEDYELVVVFSVQEEVGLKGAKTAAFKIDPDVALAVDTSIAGDLPGIEPDESNLEIGNGFEITMMQSSGRGLITPEKVRNWLVNTAEDEEFNFQRGVWEGGATDAAKIYLVREGIPTGSIGVPTRHIHSSTEMVDISDMKETLNYLEETFETLPEYF